VSAPEVSILMPMKNGRAFVRDAVASVLSQEGVDLELIVVDDGSDDGSPAIVAALEDRRVHLLMSHGAGIAAACNTALEAARGRFLARCDSDDLYEPGRLTRQLTWLRRHEDYAAICGGYATMTRRGRLIADLPCGSSAEEVTAEMAGGHVRTSLNSYLMGTDLVRRLGGWREYFAIAEDIDLQLRLAERGRVWFDPQRCHRYRLHDESITHASSAVWRGFYDTAARHFQRQRRERGQDDLERGCPPPPPQPGTGAPSRCRSQIQGHLLGAAWTHHAAGRRKAALHAGLRACLARPTNARAWRSLGALALRGREK
jgi:glycosyltransferase involved in cell wall biosynthesis